MPLRVTDQTHWCPSTAGLRWARQDSVDLIGHIASGLSRGVSERRGASKKARSRPGSFYPAIITNKRKYTLATPPQPHGRKKLEPKWAAVINLNG